MASWFLVGTSATTWTPQSSQPLRHWQHWWWKLMLCSYHSKIHGLTKVKVTGVEPPITLVVSGLDSSLIVAPSHARTVLPEAQAGAPPIVWQSPGGSLIMGTSLDYKNWMASMQVEWNEGSLAPLVWCVLWWWLGWLAACHCLGLQVWCWVVPAYQPVQ